MVVVVLKSAFNSISWGRTGSALVGIAGYLASFVENYLSKRTVRYGTNDVPKEYVITAGVRDGDGKDLARKIRINSGG